MKPEEFKLPKEKFVLVNEDKKLRDKELVTKPVGYFRDAMNRFAKNKGSIIGAIVIGILVLYAIIAPIVSPYTVSYNDAYYAKTLPKIFNSEKIDFIDGGKKQTSNLALFVQHYSMGLETGHNAVKRQEYKYDADKEMYTYRLDTYESVGTVFMSSVSKKDYLALQDYQDRTGIQIIYPITDPAKRPQQGANATNANYWYETERVGSVDVPINYTINEDGTLTLPNIYKAYEKPTIDSSMKDVPAIFKFEQKGAGYAARIIRVDKDSAKSGDAALSYHDIGYLSYYIEENDHFFETTSSFEDAIEFSFNDTYSTLVFDINGHEDATLDGQYFFALSTVTDSKVFILKTTQLGDADYAPFALMENETKIAAIDVNKQYSFSAKRESTSTKNYYYGSFTSLDTDVQPAEALGKSTYFNVIVSGGNYLLQAHKAIDNYYLNVVADGNNNKFVRVTNEVDAVEWEYDAVRNAFKINVGGHTNAALDGYYYLTLTPNGKNNAVTLTKEDGIDAEGLFLFNVLDSAGVAVAAVSEGNNYFLGAKRVDDTSSVYSFNGAFKGDNYHSKMRIEGEDTYTYCYAIQKVDAFEIRVNYHEYYKYYHKEILKDKIRDAYFIFGTTSISGQDIFVCLASGARFSFLFAIGVALVNFLIGTIYGAIEGYYGGKIDMIMERIVEILSAVPFMIVITLLKYHMGGTSQALILFISFFLTGWIGMSGTVRMQFYRFKNQEYVLASRTLGAKDPRIMFKHIFPNSLGTIITSSVLVIPGMIFSETSLSYLGIINLNSGTMTSVGTLLAAGRADMVEAPHVILFPAIFISLLMLCFNLFGNGLRDAFNPSLRGVEE